MMQIDPTKTVRELAVEIPGATRVFEKLKIDYCCGGHEPIGQACDRAGVNIDLVRNWLAAEEASAATHDKAPAFDESLANLSEYIVTKHHVYTRDALQRIALLLVKVCDAHGANHSELLQIRSEFQTLSAELTPHMMKEENILFPYISRMQSAVTTNTAPPFAPFGTVQNPINMMMREHDAAGEVLKRIRQLSKEFSVPADACLSYQTLYTALQELEADLHQHIHLENNVLFPQAIAMEENA
jgi:regulator of cell morphogenesis and NO signaling